MDSPTSSVKLCYIDAMVTWCRRRTWKPSIPNAWPCFWSTSWRVRDLTRRPLILNIAYRYGCSASALENGSKWGPFTQQAWTGLPYAVIAVDRLTVGYHLWCILHLRKDESFTKVVIKNVVFTDPEELLFCVGVIESVLVYTGRNTHGSFTCRILSCDTMVGQLYEQ